MNRRVNIRVTSRKDDVVKSISPITPESPSMKSTPKVIEEGIIDVDRMMRNSYTSSLCQRITQEAQSNFEGDMFSLRVEGSKLMVTNKRKNTCEEVPLLSITKADRDKESSAWVLFCKDMKMVFLGVSSRSPVTWINDGLHCWNLRVGMQTGVNGSSMLYSVNGFCTSLSQKTKQLWYVQEFNTGYRLCDTYPQQLVMPENVHYEEVEQAATHCVNGRFPVVAWVHPSNMVSLIRGSETRCNSEKRYYMDTQLLFKYSGMRELHIIDFVTREAEEVSSLHDLMRIQQVHFPEEIGLSGHYSEYTELFFEKQYDFIMSSIDQLPWILDISKMLESVKKVNRLLSQKIAVMVQSHDGTDIPAVVISLVMICGDPNYRTIAGLFSLIEKEWVLMGYPFARCNGIGKDASLYTNEPVAFILFIHCLEALRQQNPRSFEFTSELLIFILDELYKGRCDTFMFNNERQRRRELTGIQTYSLFDAYRLTQRAMRNPLYQPIDSFTVSSNILTIPLWTQYYLRYIDWDIAKFHVC